MTSVLMAQLLTAGSQGCSSLGGGFTEYPATRDKDEHRCSAQFLLLGQHVEWCPHSSGGAGLLTPINII